MVEDFLQPCNSLHLVFDGEGPIEFSVVRGGKRLADVVECVFQAPDLLRERLKRHGLRRRQAGPQEAGDTAKDREAG